MAYADTISQQSILVTLCTISRQAGKVILVDCQVCDTGFCPYYEVLLCPVDWNETVPTIFKAK